MAARPILDMFHRYFTGHSCHAIRQQIRQNCSRLPRAPPLLTPPLRLHLDKPCPQLDVHGLALADPKAGRVHDELARRHTTGKYADKWRGVGASHGLVEGVIQTVVGT